MKNFCMFVLGFVSLMATACGGGVDYPVDANSGGVGGGETSEASGPSTSSYSSSTTTSSSSASSGGGGDGGAPATSSVGVGGSGGECTPHMTVQAELHSNMDVAPGEQDVPTLYVIFSVSDCSDIEITNVGLQLVTPDADPNDQMPFCAAPCVAQEDWNFRNLKLKSVSTNATLMGPTVFKSAANNQPARVDFTDSFTVSAGTWMEAVFTFDIADPFVTPISGMKFQAIMLGVNTNPYTEQLYQNLQDPADYITIQ